MHTVNTTPNILLLGSPSHIGILVPDIQPEARPCPAHSSTSSFCTNTPQSMPAAASHLSSPSHPSLKCTGSPHCQAPRQLGLAFESGKTSHLPRFAPPELTCSLASSRVSFLHLRTITWLSLPLRMPASTRPVPTPPPSSDSH